MDIAHSMEPEELADDIMSAESLLTRHDERKIEIEAREEMFSSIIANGQEMIETGHHSTEEVMYLFLRIRAINSWLTLSSSWDICLLTLYCLTGLYFTLSNARWFCLSVGKLLVNKGSRINHMQIRLVVVSFTQY